MTNMVASLHHTISSHTSDINGVCFSVDNKLASCSADKTVRLWEPGDFIEHPSSPLCGHSYYVHCCAFSPFGTLLATCSTDGKLILWDAKSGTKTAVFQHDSKSPIRVCKFAPNSSLLASGGDDNNVCLWDVTAKTLIRTFQGHEATVFGCDFTPDSNYIVSGSSDGDLQVWDAKFGHGKSLCMVLEGGHDLGVTCCEFSSTYGTALKQDNLSGSTHFLLATSGQDDLVKLWDFISVVGTTSVLLKEKGVLKGHTGPVMQCRFSSNGKLLASASMDKTVRLWDPVVGITVHVIEGHTRYVTCCAFSYDNCYLATGSNDKTVMVWKLSTENQLISALASEDQYIADNLTSGVGKVKGPVRKQPETWTVDEVCKWVTEIGLAEYEDKFRKNEIDGQELLTLTQETLETALGVEALGHRNKILRSRSQLMQHPLLQKKDSGTLDSGVPDEYLCPITHSIMKDPVICTDGYTYERTAIMSWINSGKDRSPMTNSVFTSKDLTPNCSLKMIIQRHLNP